MKRIISFILLPLFIFFSFPVYASSDNISIVVNLSNVNSDRRENQTILYNKRGESTGTNEWGYEVVVTNGRVSSIGGNDNIVPNVQNSYVVSAHGTAVEHLLKIELAMKAVYDSKNKTVTFIKDTDAIYTLLEIKRIEAVDAKNNAINNYYIISESANSLFIEAENKYLSYVSGLPFGDVNDLIDMYERVVMLYRDTPAVEYRGVWVRPTQRNDQEVEAFVRKCCAAGINMISIETMYDCTFICPMPNDSLFEHNPYFCGFDVLASFSKICKTYGIELHCWMHTFSVGDPYSVNLEQSVITKKPEWRLSDSNGELYDYFLNPALDEVQEYLINTYKYILETYDFDAFQLDTIRYPAIENGIDYGYDDIAISQFKNEYPQYNDMNIEFNTNAVYWQDWADYRKSLISKFVGRVRALIDEVAPDVILSADVNAVLSASPDTCYQDSAYWLSQGWLDMIHPMAYGANDQLNVQRFFEYADVKCWVVPALGVFVEEFDVEDILAQTQQMLDIGCKGVSYFAENDFFGKNCDDILVETIFNTSALPPLFNNANTAIAELNDFMCRLESAYYQGDINKNIFNTLYKKADNISKDIKLKGTAISKEGILELKDTILSSVSDSSLLEMLLVNLNACYDAVLRNYSNDEYQEMLFNDLSIPQDAVGQTQLIIDKINSSHIGEDSVLITDPLSQDRYNVKYAYIMLFECVDKASNRYRLIEAHQNYGTVQCFDTSIKDNMLVLSFHSNDIGEGVERRELAKTILIGTEMILWGVDINRESFSALRSMMYTYGPTTDEPAEDSSVPTIDVSFDSYSEMISDFESEISGTDGNSENINSQLSVDEEFGNESNLYNEDSICKVSEVIDYSNNESEKTIFIIGILGSITFLTVTIIFLKKKKINNK